MLLIDDISPLHVKAYKMSEKIALCEEIRSLLISVVTRSGGHLASNLGTVELIVAMHTVFTTPKDKFVFDVGHQAYTHKILTGRRKEFEKLRTAGGIAGFPRPSESEHDAFIAGHSSISISAGLGIASAKTLRGEDGKVVVVVGDGAFTGGEIYEGINNMNKRHGNFIVILNDNEMSISKNSGAFADYLSQIRSTKKYYETKNRVKEMLGKSALGKEVSRSVSGTKKFVKRAIIQDNLFENLGFKYFGPIDGHNLSELIYILELVKTIDEPCLVHIKTKKGKGYFPAEENAGKFHGIEKPKISEGVPEQAETKAVLAEKPEHYSEVFGKEIAFLGGEDSRICLITAAMKYATGCNFFAKQFRNRFFDTGIAEGHAITFAAGLASQGLLPVFAVYSTFLQRGFDQILHDAAIEKLHIVLAVDRAGLNGEDGETHQGTFDVGLLSLIPNTTVYSPFTSEEVRLCLKKALYLDEGIVAVRYPRGIAHVSPAGEACTDYALYERGVRTNTLVITYGRLSKAAVHFAKHGADVMRLVKIHPISEEAYSVIKGYGDIVFFEEGSIQGGVAQSLFARMAQDGSRARMRVRGVEGFVHFADIESQIKECGLDYKSMKSYAELTDN